jgi:heme-degrading monooxygenase HmoA
VQAAHDKESELEAFYYAGDPVEDAPGYVGRQLLKDRDHPGRYFYLSYWASFEALTACRASESSKAKALEMNAAQIFAAPIDLVECELCYDHRAGAPSLPRDIR